MKPSLITIIAGSRTVDEYRIIREGMKLVPWRVKRVISGACRGPDRLGERWAHEHSIPMDRYPAKWGEFGKSAGYRRNELMAEKAEALVAFHELNSRGTSHMIDIAKRYNLEILILGVNDDRNPYVVEHRPRTLGPGHSRIEKTS